MAAFAAALGLLVLLAWASGSASPRVPAPVLDAYEVGYLAGGAQRAAEVVIGELTTSSALRVDSAGGISQASTAELAAWLACAHGIAAQAVPDGLSAQKVRKRLAEDPGIAAIGGRLRAERLLLARSWVIAARVTAWALWLALMVAGALRMAEGIARDLDGGLPGWRVGRSADRALPGGWPACGRLPGPARSHLSVVSLTALRPGASCDPLCPHRPSHPPTFGKN